MVQPDSYHATERPVYIAGLTVPEVVEAVKSVRENIT
jgi:hypothetical protein